MFCQDSMRPEKVVAVATGDNLAVAAEALKR